VGNPPRTSIKRTINRPKAQAGKSAGSKKAATRRRSSLSSRVGKTAAEVLAGAAAGVVATQPEQGPSTPMGTAPAPPQMPWRPRSARLTASQISHPSRVAFYEQMGYAVEDRISMVKRLG
jgi:hypothetical protein